MQLTCIFNVYYLCFSFFFPFLSYINAAYPTKPILRKLS